MGRPARTGVAAGGSRGRPVRMRPCRCAPRPRGWCSGPLRSRSRRQARQEPRITRASEFAAASIRDQPLPGPYPSGRCLSDRAAQGPAKRVGHDPRTRLTGGNGRDAVLPYLDLGHHLVGVAHASMIPSPGGRWPGVAWIFRIVPAIGCSHLGAALIHPCAGQLCLGGGDVAGAATTTSGWSSMASEAKRAQRRLGACDGLGGLGRARLRRIKCCRGGDARARPALRSALDLLAASAALARA